MSPKTLTPDQKAQYRRDGYLVLPGFKSTQDMAAVRTRAGEIVEAFDPAILAAGQGIFTTQEQSRATDDYFMGSADTIRCFFEEEAFDAQGQLKQPKALSINKIGHALHDLDPVFKTFSHSVELAQLATDLGLAQPQVWQSQYIFKQPGIGGEVRWHQDATFFETTPVTVTTFWFALEDATRANGCLWVQPGEHTGPLRERFVRTREQFARVGGSSATLEKLDTTPWPDESTALALEVSAGSLVVFHGLLPHYSAANRSARSRHAYTLHVTDASAAYSPRNWLQRSSTLPVQGLNLPG